jgi:PAS domain S-box-containing protein
MKNEYLELLIDSFPGAMIIVDKNGTILGLNKGLAQILSKPKEELIGTPAFIHIEKQIAKSRLTILHDVVTKKQSMTFIDYERKRWWKTTAIPLMAATGNVSRVAGYIQDITEEKENEQKKLLNQEKHYKALIEHSSDLITIVNAEGKGIYNSPSLKTLLGYDPAKRLNQNTSDNVHPEDVHLMEESFRKIASRPGATTKEMVRVRHKNGSYRYFETILSNQLNNPNIKGFIANSRDITEKEEAKQKYQTLVENINDGVFVLDKNGYFTYVNPAIEKRSGFTAKQFSKLHFNDIILKEYHQSIKRKFEKIFKGENVEPYVVKYLTRGGIDLFVEINAKPLYDGNKIVSLLGMSRDVTAREKYKKNLLEQKKYLESLMNSTSEIIFTIDKDNMIGIWNKAAEMNTGIKQKEIQGKTIQQLDLFDNNSEIEEYIKGIIDGKPSSLLQIVINTIKIGRRIWEVSSSVVKKEGISKEIIFVCRDITFKDEIHGKLVPGVSYLISDITIDSTRDLFKSLLHQQWNGYYITRTNEELEQVFHEKIPKYSAISSDQDNPNNINNLDELYINISKFVKINNRNVILLDRIDYLVSMFSFNEVLSTLYKIIDIIKQQQGILLLRTNKLLFTVEQYEFLKEELNKIPSKELENVGLEDAVYEILHYIWQQNTKNRVVTQKHVCAHCDISKITAQKRIEDLLTKGLVLSKKQGRSKHLHATDKGKELLQKHITL